MSSSRATTRPGPAGSATACGAGWRASSPRAWFARSGASGSCFAVELVQDATTNEPFPAERKLGEALRMTALDNGLILRIDPDWFAVCPPLIAEDGEIDDLADRIERSLDQALAKVRA